MSAGKYLFGRKSLSYLRSRLNSDTHKGEKSVYRDYMRKKVRKEAIVNIFNG